MQRKSRSSKSKEKVGTILDTDVVRIIKDRSVKEDRTMSDIIEEAVIRYNDLDVTNREIRRNAVKSFCSRPFNLKTSELEELMNEDFYEV